MFASSTPLVKRTCVARVRRPYNQDPSSRPEGRYSQDVRFELQVANSVFGKGEGWQRASQLCFLPNKLCPSFLIAKLRTSPQRGQEGEEEPGKDFRL